ncbi:hypothetical protein [Kitasatospora sp. NPDC056531]|uniref:hypothetical protein n=1 Tax=Kitasatospora sp. NPDC056531 TaxID=3345856 RepID=UPI00369C7967
MTPITFTWTPGWAGSADCTINDGRSEGKAHASYISNAPEDLLSAVTRVVLGARMVKAQFEGEPGAHRWIFHRYGDFVDIDLLLLEDGQRPDSEGQVNPDLVPRRPGDGPTDELPYSAVTSSPRNPTRW